MWASHTSSKVLGVNTQPFKTGSCPITYIASSPDRWHLILMLETPILDRAMMALATLWQRLVVGMIGRYSKEQCDLCQARIAETALLATFHGHGE